MGSNASSARGRPNIIRGGEGGARGVNFLFVSPSFAKSACMTFVPVDNILVVDTANSQEPVAFVFNNCINEIEGYAKKEKGKQESIPVVCDYLEVFPEDLTGLPPDRSIKFKIDLVPEAAPVARAPYQLAPSELKELVTQLKDLLDNGFIKRSTSPWGAPVLFVKKNDGSMRM
ncbi:uncharacterized protein LOC112502087 [Cynara cardunculus var. scolymus]|uniref:uncharacterized protein LOC112502087 n=1 Tax=Cynara cardunculus var. scolymus TaxID=59895 RepID=UPI000D625192|nr:uncharacterized protein LOC112502087 [Cynara cardunculus var. scolymus]